MLQPPPRRYAHRYFCGTLALRGAVQLWKWLWEEPLAQARCAARSLAEPVLSAPALPLGHQVFVKQPRPKAPVQ